MSRDEVKEIFKPCDLITEQHKERYSTQIFDSIVRRAKDGEVEAVNWLSDHGYMQVKSYAPLILVSADVLAGIEAVRLSGKTNMLHLADVVLLAASFGHGEAAEWLVNNKDEYCRGIIHGFTLDEEPDGWSDEAVAARTAEG